MNQIKNKQCDFIIDMFELERLEREFQKAIKYFFSIYKIINL